ncbi:IclR family transcriptional regulator [Mycolicibacterium smegmatis]|uniref:Putative transcription regulator n=1 Tax=Mycolicibacterium smegmatis (strain MKD8) TaxID=1214915 RepID=A0A2U9PHN1_MYCSE|nr:IclR family transcriptional regulator [Mycolicibacterium smegmatis]AWT51205.1 putative transcription regulator [Mycolicibacterium smegmatis MKD8]
MTEPRDAQDGAKPDILTRAMRVLEALAGMEQPAGLPGIAAAVGLSKVSTYRVLCALQNEGYIDHLGRQGYRIGSRSMALGSLIGPRPALLQRARPVLSKLAALAHENVTLHLRSGDHRVLVSSAAPNGPRARGARVGERSPLTSGCSGRAILAHLPANETAKVLAAHCRGGNRVEMESELATVRSDGYAMSFGENHPHLNGVGAALLDPLDKYPLGSIAVAGPDERLPESSLRRLAQSLTSECARLAPHFAAVLGPNSTIRLESLDVAGYVT